MVMPALAGAELAAYRRTLVTSHEKRIRIALLDRAGNTVADLSSRFQGGQVMVDAAQDVNRSCTVSILDPKRQLGFDADTYQGQELDLTRMLRAWWVIDGPLLSRHVSLPVHTGPLVRLRRDGPLVTLEAQSKEVYGLTPTMRTLTIKKGARRTDAIKIIMRERMGETRLGGIPNLPAKLPADVVVGPKDQAWKRAESLARSLSRELWYGADGVPRLTTPQQKATWSFLGDDPQATITSPVSVTADLQAVKNHIRVTGATPKGKKKPVTGKATADLNHPLSPWRLGPPDAPVWLIEEVNNPHLRTEKECNDYARARLAAGLRLLHETSFNALPVPHLEPRDLIRVSTNYETVTTRLDTFTLPLGTGSDMTVGYLDPYRLSYRRSKPKTKPKK